MIQIDLPIPKECACAYAVIERPASKGVSEIKTYYPCPCYDGDMMECQAVVPNRKLYDSFNGIDELHDDYRPKWCPLIDMKPVKRHIAGRNRLGYMVYLCGWCEASIVISDNYCRECGRKIAWEDHDVERKEVMRDDSTIFQRNCAGTQCGGQDPEGT